MDIDPDDLPLGFLLNTLGRLLYEETHNRLAGSEVDVIELGILWLIDLRPGRLQTEYARFQHRDATTFGRYIDKLEAKRLVLRETIPGDRRAKGLRITAAGRRVLRQGKNEAIDAEQAVLRMTDAERKALRKLLGKNLGL